MYPNFFRTVPDDEMQYVAIVTFLERMKWNWVGIITSDDEYGEREIRQLSKYLTNHGICIEFKILVSKENYNKNPPELRSSTTQVLIICGSVSMTYYKFLLGNIPYHTSKTFILPDSWSSSNAFFFFSNCSLVFIYPNFYITELQEYFDSFNLSSPPDDPLLEDILISQYRCFSKNQMKNLLIPRTTGLALKNCNLETLSSDLHHEEKTSNRVYIAVYILAQALHDMYFSFKVKNKKSEINFDTLRYKVSSLKYMEAKRTQGREMWDYTVYEKATPDHTKPTQSSCSHPTNKNQA
ncbi:LOW QUALITY PROTEIN: taste receptor type 1 member 3-like [Mantella aurantiaca]